MRRSKANSTTAIAIIEAPSSGRNIATISGSGFLIDQRAGHEIKNARCGTMCGAERDRKEAPMLVRGEHVAGGCRRAHEHADQRQRQERPRPSSLAKAKTTSHALLIVAFEDRRMWRGYAQTQARQRTGIRSGWSIAPGTPK